MAKNLKQLKAELQRAIQEKDWTGGAKIMEEWCRIRPDDTKAWYYRAYFFMKMGLLPESRTYAEKALTLDPNHREAQSLLNTIAGQTRPEPEPEFDDDPQGGLWQVGNVVEGRYEVRGAARGGMGEVYFAFDRELDRMVAVKTPLPFVLESEEYRARFYRESEAWIGLGFHPNICSAYYLQEIGGLLRLFIEYVDGGTLADRLRKNPDMPMRERLDLAIQVAAGMSHTHTFPWRDEEGTEHFGLVHRDLKPANILMEKDGLARVTDFGLVGKGTESEAKREALEFAGMKKSAQAGPEPAPVDVSGVSELPWRTMTAAGVAVGTPPYMAPEQWEGAHLALRPADVYAYGCILYEIFCGRRPYILDSKIRRAMPDLQIQKWKKLHGQTPIPDPRHIKPGLDDELSELLMACLAKDQNERPRDFETIREQLKNIHRRVEGWRVPFMRPDPKASELVADALNNQGVSYYAIGYRNRSGNAWIEALEKDPHHVEATYNLSMQHWRYDGLDSKEARRRMKEVCRTHDNSCRALMLLGRMNLFFGKTEKSVQVLEKAVHCDKDDTRAWRELVLARLAAALSGSNGNGWPEVLSAVKGVIAGGHEDAAVIAAWVLALSRTGKTEQSLKVLEKYRPQYPELSQDPESAALAFLPYRYSRLSRKSADRTTAVAAVSTGKCRYISGDAIYETSLGTGSSEGPDAPVQLVELSDSSMTALDPSGKYCVVLNETGMIRAYPVGGSDPVAKAGPISGTPQKAALGPGGSHCLVTGPDGVSIWSLKKNLHLKTIAGGESPVTCAAFHPTGRYIATGSANGLVGYWAIKTGSVAWTGKGHSAPITATAVSGNGEAVFSGDQSGIIRAWESETGRLSWEIALDEPVYSLCTTVDGRAIYIGLESGPAVIELKGEGFDPTPVVTIPIAAGQAEALEAAYREKIDEARSLLAKDYCLEAYQAVSQAREVEGYGRAPEALELSGDLAARFPAVGLTAAWELADLTGHEKAVNALAVCANRNIMLSAGQDGELRVWDLREAEWKFILSGHQGPVNCVAMDAFGKLAVSGGEDHSVRLWDLEHGRSLDLLKMHKDGVIAAAMSPDGRCAVTAGRDNTLILWDLNAMDGKPLKGHTAPVSALAIRPDGRMCASAGVDKVIRLWNLETGKCEKELVGHTDMVTSLVYRPDGKGLVSAGSDRMIRIWRPDTFDLPKVLEGHEASVTSLAVSPDSKFILSAAGHTFKLWDMIKAVPLRTFQGHTTDVSAVAFSANGQSAVSSGMDGLIRLWHLDWQPEVKNWAFWDDGASCFLHHFLVRHTPYMKNSLARKGKAQWNDQDFAALMDELRRRGYGWLRDQGVKNQLDELAYYWEGPPGEPETFWDRVKSGQALSDLFETVLHTFQQPKDIFKIWLPAVALIVCLIFIRSNSLFTAGALVIILYFILLGAFRFKT